MSATFALNYALSGMAPFAYGATNFGLLLASAALLFLVAQRLGLSAVPSALAAALWAFNFHGINMALLWVSGRTALLLTCAALASTLAVLSGRMMIGGVLCLLAMLSKEEAVPLPFLLACWLYRVRRLSSMWPLLRRSAFISSFDSSPALSGLRHLRLITSSRCSPRFC